MSLPQGCNPRGEGNFSLASVVAYPTILVYNSCMSDAQPPTNITIRIPAEIAEMLRRLAKQHDRSLNGEIVRALREYTAREYTEKHRGEE
jgi:hypothetical protein